MIGSDRATLKVRYEKPLNKPSIDAKRHDPEIQSPTDIENRDWLRAEQGRVDAESTTRNHRPKERSGRQQGAQEAGQASWRPSRADGTPEAAERSGRGGTAAEGGVGGALQRRRARRGRTGGWRRGGCPILLDLSPFYLRHSFARLFSPAFPA